MSPRRSLRAGLRHRQFLASDILNQCAAFSPPASSSRHSPPPLTDQHRLADHHRRRTVRPGNLGPFLSLAGGKDQPIVFIPTAGDPDTYDDTSLNLLRKAGATNLTLLHTRDRNVADSEAFVEPLRKARAVFFAGGRQWRLADAYLEREPKAN